MNLELDGEPVYGDNDNYKFSRQKNTKRKCIV